MTHVLDIIYVGNLELKIDALANTTVIYNDARRAIFTFTYVISCNVLD